MKRGLILINAYSNAASELNQSGRLKREFAELGVEITIKRNDGYTPYIGGGEIVNEYGEYDFCVYLDKDKYLSHALEKAGMRLFNCHEAIQACDDKMETHLLLSGKGVPMPDTVSGMLCYVPNAKIKKDALDVLEKRLGYPMIAKACYGSLGKNVYKIDDRAELEEIAEKLKCTQHLFQKCIVPSLGKDIRVIVIGGKVTAAMLRQSNGDFRSNIELGGTGTKIEVDDKLNKLCERVAEILNLDYCGIDVLLDNDGYCICEVNSNAFFGGIEKVTGVNVAKAYTEHIYKVMYK